MNIRKIENPLKKIAISTNKAKVLSMNDVTKFLLVGNPNTGKTTLFNLLTHSSEHVGNWHGVTVSEKEKIFFINEQKCVLVDLPGVYSLTPLSYEEEVASEYILKNINCPIINICDINNLKRNLFLTLQMQEINKNIILFVNTFKNINKKSQKILKKIKYIEKILKKLNINYFIGNAENKKDIKIFKKQLAASINGRDASENKKELKNIKNKFDKYNINDFLEINTKKFNQINHLFNENVISNKKEKAYGVSFLDKILLNKFLALPIFFGILFLIFYLTFFSFGATLSNLLRELIQNVIGAPFVNWLRSICDIVWVVDLVETGIIGGVGSLLSFLPQIILLFFFLSLIEDSGYLARVAFLFEDIFAKVGLSGKSVYSLLMGFGCSTTAALTARNMEDKNAKIKTALLTPYMSCSAKLPIYAVIGGAFFGATNVIVIFGLYLLGVVVALLLSLILEQKILKSQEQSFILEFPAYRIPSPTRIVKILWENVKLFLIRIGTVIFALNIIIWILQSFSFSFKFVTTQGGVSMLQAIGSLIAPIFIPLGFGNWGAASALVSGLAAKEIIISSIAMFNGVNVGADDIKAQTMRSVLDPACVVCFTPSSAFSFMVFCLLYSPCLATISVFRKEIGKKWTILSVIIQFVVAYTLALISFNLYRLVEIWGGVNVLFAFLGIVLISGSICYIVGRIKNRKFCSYCKGNCKKCKKN